MAMFLAKKPSKASPAPTRHTRRIRTLVSTCVLLVFFGSILLVFRYQNWIQARFFTPPFVTIESTEDRTEVFLVEHGEKTKLSSSTQNHRDPFWRGDFVVWIEEPIEKSEKYVVRYHIPTHTTLRLTTQNVAQRPRVSTEGYVVWQGWTEKGWQVFFSDGGEPQQVSELPNALNPDVAGNLVVYSQKNEANIWQASTYDRATQQRSVVKEGIEAKFPYFEGTTLKFAAGP